MKKIALLTLSMMSLLVTKAQISGKEKHEKEQQKAGQYFIDQFKGASYPTGKKKHPSF